MFWLLLGVKRVIWFSLMMNVLVVIMLKFRKIIRSLFWLILRVLMVLRLMVRIFNFGFYVLGIWLLLVVVFFFLDCEIRFLIVCCGFVRKLYFVLKVLIFLVFLVMEVVVRYLFVFFWFMSLNGKWRFLILIFLNFWIGFFLVKLYSFWKFLNIFICGCVILLMWLMLIVKLNIFCWMLMSGNFFLIFMEELLNIFVMLVIWVSFRIEFVVYFMFLKWFIVLKVFWCLFLFFVIFYEYIMWFCVYW